MVIFAIERVSGEVELLCSKLFFPKYISTAVNAIVRQNMVTGNSHKYWVLRVVHDLTDEQQKRLEWVLKTNTDTSSCYAEMHSRVLRILADYGK